jgi:hypothetical protein
MGGAYPGRSEPGQGKMEEADISNRTPEDKKTHNTTTTTTTTTTTKQQQQKWKRRKITIYISGAPQEKMEGTVLVPVIWGKGICTQVFTGHV